jgi:hypothetical protein
MATSKLLKRIVAPNIAFEEAKNTNIASQLHNYTHGINSDPLTLLASKLSKTMQALCSSSCLHFKVASFLPS